MRKMTAYNKKKQSKIFRLGGGRCPDGIQIV